MTTRGRINATIVAIWAAVVGLLGWHYSQNPDYVQHDHPVRNTGNPFNDRWSEHFPMSAFTTAAIIATAAALVLIMLASVWTTTPREVT